MRFITTQFFRSPHDLRMRYGEGTWALISGSSGGIGRGFAVELALRGFNICLVSRNLERLHDAEKEVKQANPMVETRVVVADFTEAGSTTFWDKFMKDMGDISISILVNNVGINHTESFTTVPETFLLDIVSVNCTTQLVLTRRLINGMISRAQSAKKRCAIINVSSVAGQRPLLYLAPYSATKAFNDFFSRALALEFQDTIDVLSLRAGYVVSNMSKLTEPGGFVLDRYECAAGCLDKLGFVTETYGDPRHVLYARSFFLLPERLLAMRRRKRLVEKQRLVNAINEHKG